MEAAASGVRSTNAKRCVGGGPELFGEERLDLLPGQGRSLCLQPGEDLAGRCREVLVHIGEHLAELVRGTAHLSQGADHVLGDLALALRAGPQRQPSTDPGGQAPEAETAAESGGLGGLVCDGPSSQGVCGRQQEPTGPVPRT